jgi:hypothetical protein
VLDPTATSGDPGGGAARDLAAAEGDLGGGAVVSKRGWSTQGSWRWMDGRELVHGGVTLAASLRGKGRWVGDGRRRQGEVGSGAQI